MKTITYKTIEKKNDYRIKEKYFVQQMCIRFQNFEQVIKFVKEDSNGSENCFFGY